MGKALLVMDMQNICVGENHARLFTYERDKLIKNINKKIEEYEPDSVFYIRNLMKDNFLSKLAPFKVFDGMVEAELTKELLVVSDHIFSKYEGDAFSNEKFAAALKEKNVKELEIVGVDGGGCVSRTALGAVKAGYEVILPTECIGTIMMKKEKKLRNELLKLGAVYR